MPVSGFLPAIRQSPQHALGSSGCRGHRLRFAPA